MGLFGMDSYMVQVEADLSQGLPRFDIVGLPDAAISEAKNRVRSAIKNTGFAFPVSRITVNLAPADTRKEGSVYDLPILMALLKAGRQINFDSDNMAFIGEVALDGLVAHGHNRRKEWNKDCICPDRERGGKLGRSGN